MLILKSTDKITLITSSAADTDVHASFADFEVATEAQQPGSQNTTIASATTTDIVAAPATAAFIRNVKGILIKNTHASTAVTVTPQINIAGTLYELAADCVLLAGESLQFCEGQWLHYDANAAPYERGFPAATQAEMEAATSLTTGVTPGRQHYHPSAAKFWVKFTGNSTTILASYNMTSITDGTTQATVTIATDFSSADWCIQATAVAAAASAAGARLASCLTMAAGSVIVFCTDAAATPALQDPTAWCVSGLGDHA